jgi:hypothetical protein
MALVLANQMWDFGGFDVTPSKVTTMVIPRVQTRLQSFLNLSPSDSSFTRGERPEAPTGTLTVPDNLDDTFNPILEDSSALSSSDSATLRANVDAIFRIENPKINSPDTIDCASCHAAESARNWATAKFPDLHLDVSSFQFQSKLNLKSGSSYSYGSHSMRAFGYEGTSPAISQRTINESAAMAESLNSHPMRSRSKKASF